MLPDFVSHPLHCMTWSNAADHVDAVAFFKLNCQCCRAFADVLECVKGDKARVVAVTSGSRAKEVNETERPGFFDQITKVL